MLAYLLRLMVASLFEIKQMKKRVKIVENVIQRNRTRKLSCIKRRSLHKTFSHESNAEQRIIVSSYQAIWKHDITLLRQIKTRRNCIALTLSNYLSGNSLSGS